MTAFGMTALPLATFLTPAFWMDGTMAALFTTPMQVVGLMRMGLLLPLALSVAVVYKATKLDDLRPLVPAALALWVTIVVAMYAVVVSLWGWDNLLA